MTQTISELTRKRIFDIYPLAKISWAGDLEDPVFLDRLYDLSQLNSNDGRFSTARDDIWQHRVNNYDWPDDWILQDSRFGLLTVSDEEFLRFLCETIHPVVQSSEAMVRILLDHYNERLRHDGWEIYEKEFMSGYPIYSFRKLTSATTQTLSQGKKVVESIDSSYIHTQINRIENSIEIDPELAIGTSKEFIETVCKTILEETKGTVPDNLDFPKLVRTTLKELKLVPDEIPDSAKAVETIKLLLMNLATVSNALAELRNLYGTGHGKSAKAKGLEPRHARLAAGAAITLAVFLFETYEKIKSRNA